MRIISLIVSLLLVSLPVQVWAEQSTQDQVSAYDQNLCTLAQHMVLNADTEEERALFDIKVQEGEGNGFHTIQMDADGPTKLVTIATTKLEQVINGESQISHVSCKMVNRVRVNDVLGLSLKGPDRSCGDINKYTHERALQSLNQLERARYETSGKKIRFAEDYIASSGGEWLPSKVDDFIKDIPASETMPAHIEVTAPSVRVPWDEDVREFYQGTQHCKLISLSTMRRWMLEGSFLGDKELFPPSEPECTSPTSMTSEVGSCSFYFAPSDSQFCQDYSGSGWTEGKAREECGKRHASRDALNAASGKYGGVGGAFSQSSCVQRTDVKKPIGTCVFHCRAEDETLWHTLDPVMPGPGAAMMQKACDLYIEGE